MNDAHICTRGKIWDLHIHSNQCYSITDPKLKKLSVAEYVSSILEALSDFKDLEMISFTDHNHICFDLYKAFYDAKSRISLLPGIEIDVALEKGGTAKHLVVYFDAMNDLGKLQSLATKINAFLEKRNVGSGPGKQPVDIHELLDELLGYKVDFVLSPHALKQGKRGIDYDWHPLPEEEMSNEIKKFRDQFFCFWESSGKSEIARAVEFLKRMESDELISVVAFSDSKGLEDLKAYAKEPPQYFNSLPNFNGLKLVGSEISRITHSQTFVDENDLGSFIGSIEFEGQCLGLSPRLNAIIGGRGSGKSVLLDSLANSLDPSKGDLQESRRAFVSGLQIKVRTMSGFDISSGQFRFDYYNQNYVASLFSKSGDEFNTEIEKYFSDTFSKVESIDKGSIERGNSERFYQLLESFEDKLPENIVGFVDKLVVDVKDGLEMNIGERKSKAKVEDKKLESFDYRSAVEKVQAAVVKCLPPTVAEDRRVSAAIKHLEKEICDVAHDCRRQYFSGPYLQNRFVDIFLEKKASISDAQATRKQQIDLFNEAFSHETLGIRKRVSLVRTLIKVCDGFEPYYEKHVFADGERAESFKFMRELCVEHPIDFMIRTINDCVKVIPGLGQCTRDNLWDYIGSFCFSEEGYRKGSDWERLYDKLKAFELNYEERSSIRFDSGDGVYRDIKSLSPGTQTNILIEYIVHKDTSLPLLIDQPEDNVDNQTIYKDVRNWFLGLKSTRQVIVVTHDANIVINADAENVIVAKQPSPGHFVYEYGALEYGKIIDKASVILDGGKDAVKRRLMKYGE